jgi:hypothetical protein
MGMDCNWLKVEAISDLLARSLKVLLWANFTNQVFNAQSYVAAGWQVVTPDFNWGILMLKYYSQMSDECISLQLRNYQLNVWGCCYSCMLNMF